MSNSNFAENFYSLTPEKILDAVESAMGSKESGVRATGFALALNSYENRVYEVGMEDETSVVTKFYRPGRWNAEQLLEEHLFIQKVKVAEVPAVEPLKLKDGPHSKCLDATRPTLALSSEGIYFTIFPKVKGRLLNELDAPQIRQMGRMLARLHNIGETMGPSSRPKLNIETFLDLPLSTLKASRFLDPHSAERFNSVALRLKERMTPLFSRANFIRTHGDCHLGNTIWSKTDGPFLLDFDDFRIAPAVQDIWMVVRGRDDESLDLRAEMIRAYEIFREFPYEETALIEPLRALRMIHYSYWIASRFEDPAFPKLFPNFGTPQYWQDEIEALEEILTLIDSGSSGSIARGNSGNYKDAPPDDSFGNS